MTIDETPAAAARPSRPEFIGIGAGKAGTTWVWAMLRQHPRIFLPREKELHYFDDEWYGPPGVANERAQRPLSWYRDHFADAGPDQVSGEITPTYLWSPSAPERIRAMDPDIKLFVILRDPADRVFSSFNYSIAKGEISSITFERALEEHPYIIDRTHYGRYLDAYLAHFPPEQLAILFYDDLKRDPRAFLDDLQSFLGVPLFIPDDVDEQRNVTGNPSRPRVTRALMRARMGLRRLGLERVKDAADRVGLTRVLRRAQGAGRPFQGAPVMAPETERALRERFLPDVERVEALTGRDLSAWKPESLADLRGPSASPDQVRNPS